MDTDTEITETDSQLHVALKSNNSLGGTLKVSQKTVPERTTKECASDRTSDNDNQLARRSSSSLWNAGPIIYSCMEVFIKMTNGFQSFLEGFNVHAMHCVC